MLEFEPSDIQLKFLEATERIVFFGGGAGGGKALKKGSKVLTPQGFKNIEDLSVGDYAINHVGKASKILGVYPQKPQRLYEVTFSDGRAIETTDEHIWTAFSKGSWSNITTESMYRSLDKGFSIPMVGKLSYGCIYEDLPVAPYTLGIILGDGNISQRHAAITTMDQEVVDRVRAEGYVLNKWKNGNSGKANTYGVHEVIGKLRDLGLQGTTSDGKFIPDIYKNSEYKVRAALLAGLMDSDGYVDVRGSLRYYSKSEKLCKDFLDLVWSVGGKGTVKEKFTKYNGERVKSYVVNWNHRDATDFVSIPRKLERVKVKSTTDLLKVKSIVKSGVADSFCITVKDESALYITDNFLLTHNTWAILADNLQGVHDPAYFSVFFRTTTTEIEKGLTGRSPFTQ